MTTEPEKLGPIERVKMPAKNGRPIPVPIRYACGLGHIHISRRQAVKCRRRFRDALGQGGN